ncbi:ChbG/HpnK family deacetylase [[Kitasatospora] papulosa]|uniref:ChbG/HpnK family deacetylase n=1 Tax=[Kitasatospora] papulosa TaxID=1464011 RepID=UPI0036929867
MDGIPVAHPDTASPPWPNQVLGFPPGARLLLVNCDDFGMHPAINAAVVESIEEGIAASCSLMTVCPAAADAMRLLRRHSAIPFGVHLTLVCESSRLRWGPLSPADTVPSTEFRAQIDAVADAWLSPTHLDFHCLADGGRADILDLTVGLAAEYGLAVRVWLEPGRREMRRRGLPVVDHVFLDSFSLPAEGKAEHYRRLLHDLPAGLSEWAVHPAAGRGAETLDGGRPVRRTDHAFLTSPEAREAVAREGVTVIDYRALQRVWARNTDRG